jgi:predicted SprT family Zn-dependent metalloprotease
MNISLKGGSVMDIPKTFELMGKTITVKFVTELLYESDAFGQACYRTGEIKILDNSPTYKITEDQQMRMFLHGLVHWILYLLMKDDLRKDEDFVDMFADLLMQTLKTMKGSNE